MKYLSWKLAKIQSVIINLFVIHWYFEKNHIYLAPDTCCLAQMNFKSIFSYVFIKKTVLKVFPVYFVWNLKVDLIKKINIYSPSNRSYYFKKLNKQANFLINYNFPG